MKNTKFNQEKLDLFGKRFIYQEYKPIDLAAQQAALEAVKEQEKEAVQTGKSVDQAETDAQNAISNIIKSIPDPMNADLGAAEKAEQVGLFNQVKDAANACRRAISEARNGLKVTEKDVTDATAAEGNFTAMKAEIATEKTDADGMSKLKREDFLVDTPEGVADLANNVTRIDKQVATIDARLKALTPLRETLSNLKDPAMKEKFSTLLTEITNEAKVLQFTQEKLIMVSSDLNAYKGESMKAAAKKVLEAQQASGTKQTQLENAKKAGAVTPKMEEEANVAYAEFKAAQAVAAAYQDKDNPNKVA